MQDNSHSVRVPRWDDDKEDHMPDKTAPTAEALLDRIAFVTQIGTMTDAELDRELIEAEYRLDVLHVEKADRGGESHAT